MNAVAAATLPSAPALQAALAANKPVPVRALISGGWFTKWGFSVMRKNGLAIGYTSGMGITVTSQSLDAYFAKHHNDPRKDLKCRSAAAKKAADTKKKMREARAAR